MQSTRKASWEEWKAARERVKKWRIWEWVMGTEGIVGTGHRIALVWG